MMDGSAIGRFGSGREVKRIEDEALLAGAGRFSDDVAQPGQTHLVFLRSPHAHARIVAIDTAAAAAMPGVIAVLTGADLVAAGVKPLPLAPMFKRPDGSAGATPLRPALADGTVRFVGEAVAALIAETREQAKDAVEAILVEYEELPSITDLVQAAGEGAPLVWPAATGNIAGPDDPWRRRRDRFRLRRGVACRDARYCQSAPGAGADGAAQLARVLRSGDRPTDAAPVEPDAVRRARYAVQRRARHPRPTLCGSWSTMSAAASA
ncbi:MAG: hypothetical protein WDN69_25475 [Aliidongia sp.]